MTFVDYQKKDHVAIITLNRPERLNALGREVVDGLRDACERYEKDRDARVAILTGTGRAFSAGVDLNEIAGPPDRLLAFAVVEAIRKPVIGAINGLAVAGGFHLMTTCDVRIAARSATFGLPEILRAIPMTPHYLIAQRLPVSAIMELILTGQSITAQRAFEIGLVNRVVPDAELMPVAMSIAENIAALSPLAVRLIKEAKIKAVALSEAEQAADKEMRLLERKSPDFQEGVKAFLEKRKPLFK